jgi:hypothetical protein
VDEHVDIGLRVVADRRELRIRRRIPEVLLQDVGVVEQLFEVITDLREPGWDTLRLDRRPGVGEKLLEGLRAVRSHGPLLSSPRDGWPDRPG